MRRTEKMRDNAGQRRLAKWVAAVLLIGLCCARPAVLQAASSDVVASSGGRAMFAVEFFDRGESALEEHSLYTLSEATKQGVTAGLSYWADMLGDRAQNQKPAQVIVYTDGEQNAGASTMSGIGEDSLDDLFLNQAIQSGRPLLAVDAAAAIQPDGPWSISAICIGKYLGAARQDCQYGWHIDAATVLPTNEQAADLIGALRHEMGHALGISVSTAGTEDEAESRSQTERCFFSSQAADSLSWSAHLVDQNGNFAQSGMEIVTSAEFARRQAADPLLQPEDYFIVDDLGDSAADAAQLPTAGKLYFIGNNVAAALDGAMFDGVAGLPVNAWENGSPEFSHLQTTGMMSHRSYSNYTAFMEVELAVMQDMGYAIDRRNYYGYSLYGDGRSVVNRNGYFARNAAGTAYLPGVYNTAPLGVGLHVYGANNDVTQAADILTAGVGAVGARIDGSDNAVRIARDTQIRAAGERGIGVLIAYGRHHTLTQEGTVAADGAGGVGVRFDFGSSSNGAADEYRGSYIRYIRGVDAQGEIDGKENQGFGVIDKYYPATPELDGALVDRYALSGALSGRECAVYIGKNAFVREIAILDGAQLRGDIISDWKHFATAAGIYDGGEAGETLMIQYAGNRYAYDRYIPDLTTRLRVDADLRYDGAIRGADNLKLDVLGGTLRYGGEADVVAVTVGADAALIGGSYRVNDMTAALAPGFADAEMGKFINHGVIGAPTPLHEDTALRIDGNLRSDGVVQFTANRDKVGRIAVSGSADISGSRIRVDENGVYLPNHRYGGDDIVRIARTGSPLGDFAGMEEYKTGLMDARLEDGGIHFYAADHLGARTGLQEDMRGVIGDSLTRNPSLSDAYAALYNLPADAARRALADLHGGLQADMATAVKTDRFLADAVGDRLETAGRDDGLWASLRKGWNKLDGDAALPQLKEQSFHIAVGRDRPYGEHWTAGALFAYGKHDAALGAGRGESRDYRLGLYGGYKKNAVAVDTYLFYGRQNNDATRRIADLALTARSDYHSELLGAGVKASRRLRCKWGGVWQARPYIALDAAHYRQDAGAERGAGAFNQRLEAYSDNIATVGIGIAAERKLGNRGGYAIGAGYRRVLTGEDTPLTARLAADDAASFSAYGNGAAKDAFVIRLKGDVEIHDGFRLSGEIIQTLGAHTDDLGVAAKAAWLF